MNVKTSWGLEKLQEALAQISGLPARIQCIYIEGKVPYLSPSERPSSKLL